MTTEELIEEKVNAFAIRQTLMGFKEFREHLEEVAAPPKPKPKPKPSTHAFTKQYKLNDK